MRWAWSTRPCQSVRLALGSDQHNKLGKRLGDMGNALCASPRGSPSSSRRAAQTQGRCRPIRHIAILPAPAGGFEICVYLVISGGRASQVLVRQHEALVFCPRHSSPRHRPKTWHHPSARMTLHARLLGIPYLLLKLRRICQHPARGLIVTMIVFYVAILTLTLSTTVA